MDILDQSVPKLLEAAKGLSRDEIEQLIAAETLGKTRKSAIEGLNELMASKPEIVAEAQPEPEPEPDEAPSGEVLVANTTKGTTLHLGDGRRLAYGESAYVIRALAANLE